MIPITHLLAQDTVGIPRESGDDPTWGKILVIFGAYSPRERG